MRWEACAGVLLLFVAVAGCGASPSTPEEGEKIYDNAKMEEVAELYRGFVFEFKKPPTKVADLARFEMGFPNGYRQIKTGEILVFWGIPLSDDAADKILAYEKKVPDEGGLALMQDGKTVRPITSEEFKAAPRPPGKAG